VEDEKKRVRERVKNGSGGEERGKRTKTPAPRVAICGLSSASVAPPGAAGAVVVAAAAAVAAA